MSDNIVFILHTVFSTTARSMMLGNLSDSRDMRMTIIVQIVLKCNLSFCIFIAIRHAVLVKQIAIRHAVLVKQIVFDILDWHGYNRSTSINGSDGVSRSWT